MMQQPSFWALMLLLALAMQSTSASVIEQVQQKYFFPILLFGPNNQKRDLRHTLGLAKTLDTGLVLTGIFRHYLDRLPAHNVGSKPPKAPPKGEDLVNVHVPVNNTMLPCFDERAQGFLPMQQVIDRQALDAYVPTTTVQELMAQGWDGELDALVYPHDAAKISFEGYLARMLKATGVKMREHAPRLAVMGGPLNCNRSRIGELRVLVEPFRYIGLVTVLLGDMESPDLRRESVEAPEDDCYKTVHEADRLVRPALRIRNLAQHYMERWLPTGKTLAVHIRPYPDTCLKAWLANNFSTTAHNAQKVCKPGLDDLHVRLGHCVAKAMWDSGADNLFVLTHPALRGVVDNLLLQGGVTGAHYLEAAHVTQLAQCKDSTAGFMLMVEEAIAATAHSFLGTSWSSITQSIVYERLALGQTSNQYFEHMACWQVES